MSGKQEIDPVTGHETTGHDWNGIKELNTPFPRIVIWAPALSFAYSIVAWVLLPARPLGRDYTRGLLGIDQGHRDRGRPCPHDRPVRGLEGPLRHGRFQGAGGGCRSDDRGPPGGSAALCRQLRRLPRRRGAGQGPPWRHGFPGAGRRRLAAVHGARRYCPADLRRRQQQPPRDE
ncbi:hypothetical protein KF941_05330 [Paracoccus sp. pheM1]|nr:hypothetical protein [Paracoccus sp. pheM1]